MKKLFAVDDDALVLELLSLLAKQMNYDFASASFGYDALRRIESEQPDAVVLDIVLPDMDGLTLCQQLRANPATHHIPVVMLTSMTDSASVKDAYEYGAREYLPKPVDRDMLQKKLQSLVPGERLQV